MNKSKTRYLTKGFTLIELLVVIAIIGVMASYVMASMQDARISAQYVVAQNAMKHISDAVIVLDSVNQPLGIVTGNYCSECSCRPPVDLRNLLDTDLCVTQSINAITKIDNSSPLLNGINSYRKDPWGSPYFIDENELEFGPTDCRHDFIRTAGPDLQMSTPDDLIYFMPLRTEGCLGQP